MARYSAVADRLDFGSGTGLSQRLSDVKQLLGITSSAMDIRLSWAIRSAITAADEYTNNPFHQRDTDEDSTTYAEYLDPIVELDIPEPIGTGILAVAEYEISKAPIRVSEEKVAQLQRKYAVFVTSDDLLKDVKGTYWVAYKLPPGF